MFCVHCGVRGAAAFCAACGKRQPAADANLPQDDNDFADTIVEAILVDESTLWTDSLDYELVLRQDCVRRRLAAAGKGAPAGLNSEDLLAVFDAVSPIGISLGKLNTALLPIYEKIGLKMQRTARGAYAAPCGRVLAAALCAMARMSFEINDVRQYPDTCECVARIPSGLISSAGELTISLHRSEYVEVQIRSKITGQLYDWGRLTRLIDELLANIERDLNEQMPGQKTAYRRVA